MGPKTASGNLLERRAGVALWRQIADRIRQAINIGEFGDSGMMPPEMQLAERFGVNRHTVRSALAALASEGLVQAVQGRGTMILRRDRLSYPIGKRTRFSEGLQGQAERIAFQCLGHGRTVAGAEIAEALDIPPGTECITLETLGGADGIPLSRASHVFPGPDFAAIPAHFERFGSITRALAEVGIADYTRLSTDVIARHALPDEVAELKLSPGAILLETVAVNADGEGRRIQYSRTRFAADRIKLRIES
ncbi:phosphonate metabolism transcriptional regulator PhnF [Gellertiella hungarica]|uniref:GntR family phosphonate transport system transcriptional regulator n=1 Tax=Gellertiella hungarica TaxID=1572859 RepID=A0A7W6J4W7_9HYPH|nr:phosphonate metabolism transcriptional regulator PhnF [Gellertiella hungarica]MBB4064830.1 GntR family phosphonate transport system transcriptional regulator [Gellertiella hungarica]